MVYQNQIFISAWFIVLECFSLYIWMFCIDVVYLFISTQLNSNVLYIIWKPIWLDVFEIKLQSMKNTLYLLMGNSWWYKLYLVTRQWRWMCFYYQTRMRIRQFLGYLNQTCSKSVFLKLVAWFRLGSWNGSCENLVYLMEITFPLYKKKRRNTGANSWF